MVLKPKSYPKWILVALIISACAVIAIIITAKIYIKLNPIEDENIEIAEYGDYKVYKQE